MKPITYLCFTLLSILIQFCLMDFIHERIQTDEGLIQHKETDPGNQSYLLRNLKEKPHALYYRKDQKGSEVKNNNLNTSLPFTLIPTSTDFPTTTFDFYYENASVTTDTFYNNSEYDNVTEIAFFNKKTTIIPHKTAKEDEKINKDCWCDFMFKKCDINCCCDIECSDLERNLFESCNDKKQGPCINHNKGTQFYCYNLIRCNAEFTTNAFEHMFCIQKYKKAKKKSLNGNEFANVNTVNHFKWHSSENDKPKYQFTKDIYKYSNLIWVFENETLNVISLPISVTNSYCSGKKPVKFLTNEHIKCHVKMKELHSLYVLQILNQTNVVSPRENTTDGSSMNCSTLHCVNWTLLVCDDDECLQYNKDLHKPLCSEQYCNNVAVKVEYIFYCNISIISKAIIKLHTKQVTTDISLISQEIIVKFYMGNESNANIVEYSGNPGYIRNLPIISSYYSSNHTKHFYNRTRGKSNKIILPHNKNGKCVSTNITHNVLKFGYNSRLKCILTISKSTKIHNETDECLKIQIKILDILQLKDPVFISPYGNPNNVDYDKWISLQVLIKSNVYGEYRSKKTKLICYNIITQFAFIFTHADVGIDQEENKLITAKLEGTVKNVTFSLDNFSIVLMVDTIFIDVGTAEAQYKGLRSNNVLSQNLFLPLHSHSSSPIVHSKVLILCTILFLGK